MLQVRKERYDRDCVVKKFNKGEMVVMRHPGLQSKLEGAWEGPFEILDVPSEFHVVLGIPGKNGNAMGKWVHINSCKPFHAMQVAGVAAWEVEEEEVADRKELRLQGEEEYLSKLDLCKGPRSGPMQNSCSNSIQ